MSAEVELKDDFLASLSDEQLGFFFAHEYAADLEELLCDEITAIQMRLFKHWRESKGYNPPIQPTNYESVDDWQPSTVHSAEPNNATSSSQETDFRELMRDMEIRMKSEMNLMRKELQNQKTLTNESTQTERLEDVEEVQQLRRKLTGSNNYCKLLEEEISALKQKNSEIANELDDYKRKELALAIGQSIPQISEKLETSSLRERQENNSKMNVKEYVEFLDRIEPKSPININNSLNINETRIFLAKSSMPLADILKVHVMNKLMLDTKLKKVPKWHSTKPEQKFLDEKREIEHEMCTILSSCARITAFLTMNSLIVKSDVFEHAIVEVVQNAKSARDSSASSIDWFRIVTGTVWEEDLVYKELVKQKDFYLQLLGQNQNKNIDVKMLNESIEKLKSLKCWNMVEHAVYLGANWDIAVLGTP